MTGEQVCAAGLVLVGFVTAGLVLVGLDRVLGGPLGRRLDGFLVDVFGIGE